MGAAIVIVVSFAGDIAVNRTASRPGIRGSAR